MLQSADCLKLSNAYNTELPYSAVSAALVVTIDDQQSLWLAHNMNGQYTVTVYEFYGNMIYSRYAYVCKYGYSN